MTEYGGIEVTQTWIDGRISKLEIKTAPKVVGFSLALLEMVDKRFVSQDEDGTIRVHGVWAADGEPAELAYRPVGDDQDGKVIVAERIYT